MLVVRAIGRIIEILLKILSNVSEPRLTEDGHSHTAGSDLSADFMGDGTLVGAAVP